MCGSGTDGADKMAALMKNLREKPLTEIAGLKVVGMTDFATGPEMPRVSGLQKEAPQVLPPANVIEYQLEEHALEAAQDLIGGNTAQFDALPLDSEEEEE